MNKIKVLIILLFGILGCKKADSENTERRVAKKIAKHIIERDSLKMYRYSEGVSLHIKSEKLNDENYKTYASLNGLKPKSNEYKTEKLNISGFETIIYFSKPRTKFNLPGAFFVPDAKRWNFLAEFLGNDIMLNELTFIILNQGYGIEDEPDETDF